MSTPSATNQSGSVSPRPRLRRTLDASSGLALADGDALRAGAPKAAVGGDNDAAGKAEGA